MQNKHKAIEFLNGVNTFVSKERQTTHIQAPDYTTFLVFNELGEPALPKELSLTYEELYAYWEAEIAIKQAASFIEKAAVYVANKAAIANVNDTTPLSELLQHNPFFHVYHQNKTESKIKLSFDKRHFVVMPLTYTGRIGETMHKENVPTYFLTKATRNFEFIHLNTLPDGYYTDANQDTKLGDTNVFWVSKGKVYKFVKLYRCFYENRKPALKSELKYFPIRFLYETLEKK